MNRINDLKKDLRRFERPEKAKLLERFFKTGKGEYAEGFDLDYPSLNKLLASKIHEERSVAVVILVKRFEKGNAKVRNRICWKNLRNQEIFG